MPHLGAELAAIARLEAALAETTKVIQDLTQVIAQKRDWQGKLMTSIEVMKQLSEQSGVDASASSVSINEGPDASTFDETALKSSDLRKPIRSRNPMVLRAEEELIRMLRKGGDYIRQLDAVNRLRLEHGILVGSGVAGRETSDLSAALGAGKSAYLRVSRKHGWELTEWEGMPPVWREVGLDPNDDAFADAEPDEPPEAERSTSLEPIEAEQEEPLPWVTSPDDNLNVEIPL